MLLKGDSITKNFIAKCCPHELPLQLLECLGASEHKIGENALKARDTGGWQECGRGRTHVNRAACQLSWVGLLRTQCSQHLSKRPPSLTLGGFDQDTTQIPENLSVVST